MSVVTPKSLGCSFIATTEKKSEITAPSVSSGGHLMSVQPDSLRPRRRYFLALVSLLVTLHLPPACMCAETLLYVFYIRKEKI